MELDEGYFESVQIDKPSGNQSDQKRKRGRGSQKQSPVMVMASTVHDFEFTKNHKKPTKFRYVKMKVMQDLKSETVEKIVKDNVVFGSVVKTDNYSSYGKIKNHVWVHKAQNVKGDATGKVLPWVHTMISNAKRSLLGTHHMVSKKYIQDYLDEFCYKVNRRYYEENLFDRLLIACASINYKIYINDSR